MSGKSEINLNAKELILITSRIPTHLDVDLLPDIHPMNKKTALRLIPSEISHSTFNQLYSTLVNALEDIVWEVPCKSVNYSQYPQDLAYDYLWALFVGENIASFCQPISFHMDYTNFPVKVCFVFRPKDLIGLTQYLCVILPAFDDDLDWDELDTELQNMYDKFVDNIEKIPLYFPELADSYLANFVVGIDYLYEDEEEEERDKLIKNLYNAHPEWRYGFWRSFASNNVGYDFYISSNAWIVPLNAPVEELLKKYGGFRNNLPSLEAAEQISSLKLDPIVFNKANIVLYPLNKIYEARECARDVWFTSIDCEVRRSQSGIKEYRHFSNIGSIEKLLLSTEGNILIVCDEVTQYVFFDDSIGRIKNEVIEKYLDIITKLSERARILLGKPSEIACPWDELDDEVFEQLCYDIIAYYYQPSNIRKMGKSRSRDGGRDIEFQTPERIGKNTVKWIVQCKLIRDSSSLTGTKIKVSDTVDQYGAGGFCVMTSGVIDSTLYDKLDGIARNKRIETACWSRLELERFLARHLEIRDRYFRKGIS